MKLIIDISEDLYKGIERRDCALETEYVCDELMKAIDNAIPLEEYDSYSPIDEYDDADGNHCVWFGR